MRDSGDPGVPRRKASLRCLRISEIKLPGSFCSLQIKFRHGGIVIPHLLPEPPIALGTAKGFDPVMFVRRNSLRGELPAYPVAFLAKIHSLVLPCSADGSLNAPKAAPDHRNIEFHILSFPVPAPPFPACGSCRDVCASLSPSPRLLDVCASLSLHRACRDAVLKETEQQRVRAYDGQNRKGQIGHLDIVPIGKQLRIVQRHVEGISGHEIPDIHLHGIDLLIVGDIHNGIHVIIPEIHYHEGCSGGYDGFGQWKHNLGKNVNLRCTVNLCGLLQLHRKPLI